MKIEQYILKDNEMLRSLLEGNEGKSVWHFKNKINELNKEIIELKSVNRRLGDMLEYQRAELIK